MLLAACAAPPPEPDSTSVPPEVAAIDVDVAQTCAMLSIVQTTTGNALAGYAMGTVSADDAAVILNTTPDSLTAITHLSSGLAPEVTVLLESVSNTPATIPGALFDPTAEPYMSSFLALKDACEADGFVVAGVANFPGG